MKRASRPLGVAALGALGGLGLLKLMARGNEEQNAGKIEVKQQMGREVLENWSGTHLCEPKRVFRPQSVEEVVEIVKNAHERGEKLRVMGSGLSPNGIGFVSDKEGNILTLSEMTEFLEVDKEKKQVRLQTGALMGEILDVLKEHGLTLQNLASISQQQLGGFTQVGAHGTGARIPPVEEQILELEIVTPAQGIQKLSKTQNPEWFNMVKCGLGSFGVVISALLQCTDAHKLLEKTKVFHKDEIKVSHKEWLQTNRHLRYMWIPFTDEAVVVSSNPVEGENSGDDPQASAKEAARLKPLIGLLQKLENNLSGNFESFGFGELREWLLKAGKGPLDTNHVKEVNAAELEFWRQSQSDGVIDDSFNVLAFDCGGQQLVLEVVFPCGTIDEPNGRDLEFVERLMERIKEHDFPAPAPIEQRWTCGSTSAMSPVYVSDGADKALFSWVGIIMYLPTKDPKARKEIEDKFYNYQQLLWELDEEHKFDAQTHWAKIELPRSQVETERKKAKLAGRFPLAEFAALRRKLDPKGILTNDLIEALVLQQD